MTYAVVYSSRTGNTKILAEKILEVLGETQCVYFGDTTGAVPKADLIFAGFWTDKGICSEDVVEYLEQIEGTDVFLFGTAGFGGAAEYFEQILKRVEAFVQDSCTVKGRFMCQGKMPVGVKQRYEGMLAKNPEDTKMKAMIENFDKAMAHPDERDLRKLEEELNSL